MLRHRQLLFLLIILLMLSGCFSKVNKIDYNVNTSPSTDNIGITTTDAADTIINDVKNTPNNTMSYQQYIEFFQYFADDLILEHFTLIDSAVNYIIVDTDITFNRRQFLTVNGEQNDNSTQSRLSYTTDDKKHIVFIDFIYLEQPLPNDLLYIKNATPESLKGIDVLERYGECILSYNNIIIKVTYFDNSTLGGNEEKITDQSVPIDVARAIVKYLSSNDKS